MTLRTYQAELLSRLRPNVLAVAGTGAGKSHCISAWADRYGWLGMIIIGHTDEIVRHISSKLTMSHDVIAPGGAYENRPVAVASVKTLIGRGIDLRRYLYGQFDEGHHVVYGNMWGAAREGLAHAFVIGWSATPFRLDKRSLLWAFPAGIVEGPSVAELVSAGWITGLQVYGPECPIDRDAIGRDADGELSQRALVKALRRSSMVGDVVQSYLRFAPGVRGLTFAASRTLAHEHAEAYNAAGVPARVLTSRDGDRRRVIQELTAGDVLQVVVVGMFGEGADVPSIGVVSLARPSESAGLVWQQIGRARRPAPGKYVGIVIDHAGNVREHGLPDYVDRWALDERRRAGQAKAAALTTCPACLTVYPSREYAACPACGSAPVRREPSGPRGDSRRSLEAYTPEQLAQMTKTARNAIRIPSRPPRTPVERIVFGKMRERAEQQASLRNVMQLWGQRHGGTNWDREFINQFGVHPLKAMGMSGPDAARMTERITLLLSAD
jgi:superfamily II DNA or RNA helicase